MSDLFKEYKIGEVCYKMMVPPVIEALDLSLRVGVILTPVLASSGSELLSQKGNGLIKHLRTLEPKEMMSVLMEAAKLSKLSVGNAVIANPTEFQAHFNSYRSHVYQVLGWNLWMCVKDFLPALDSSGLKSKILSLLRTEGLGESLSKSQKDGKKNTGSESL